MSTQRLRKLEVLDTASTARIDRRQSVLAQIEAALLSDKLAVLELAEENTATGTDPYNRAPRQAAGIAWDSRRR